MREKTSFQGERVAEREREIEREREVGRVREWLREGIRGSSEPLLEEGQHRAVNGREKKPGRELFLSPIWIGPVWPSH